MALLLVSEKQVTLTLRTVKGYIPEVNYRSDISGHSSRSAAERTVSLHALSLSLTLVMVRM